MARNHSGSTRNEKKRRLDAEILSSDDDVSLATNSNSWARFIVVESKNGLPLKINPFAISKAIEGICGEVMNVSRLRGGSLLIECARRQQAINLLKCSTFANTAVAVSEHRSLNSSRGIIRDRARCLAEMTEEEILRELSGQHVTSVKRFMRRDGDASIPTNTYLFTFSLADIPKSIKAGYFNIGVDVYVPNPLRCYNCQKFGHGSKFCNRPSACSRCGGHHENTGCTAALNCVNCKGAHDASSKSCPSWIHEKDISTVKYQNNISFQEAKKVVASRSPPSPQTYAAVVSRTSSTRSVECQTDLTWTDSEHPQSVSKSSESQTTSTDSQQHDSPSASQCAPTPEPSGTTKPTNDVPNPHKKKHHRKIKTKIATPTETPVDLHNFFDPLEMDITPSCERPGSTNYSSRSRERSPIDPP
ncbi:uncharacterized protein [Haliotis asinina]|uniref:uncharacterized protein n=1 Tax=Haliotis asinina TaxID=109174 RepID=UPI003532536A